MSEVAEKCIRPWGGTYVYCIIDKDRRCWDLQPPESSGLTESIFCRFCPCNPFFSPVHLLLPLQPSFSLCFLTKRETLLGVWNILNPSQVSQSIVSSCFSHRKRALHSMCPQAQHREIVGGKIKSLQQNLFDGWTQTKGNLTDNWGNQKPPAISQLSPKACSASMVSFWLCLDRRDPISCVWDRLDEWLCPTKSKFEFDFSSNLSQCFIWFFDWVLMTGAVSQTYSLLTTPYLVLVLSKFYNLRVN